MLKVFKYPIPITDEQVVMLPQFATILRVDVKGSLNAAIWALVDPDQFILERRRIRIAGTGHAIDVEPKSLVFLNTFFVNGGERVFHAFEVI